MKLTLALAETRCGRQILQRTTSLATVGTKMIVQIRTGVSSHEYWECTVLSETDSIFKVVVPGMEWKRVRGAELQKDPTKDMVLIFWKKNGRQYGMGDSAYAANLFLDNEVAQPAIEEQATKAPVAYPTLTTAASENKRMRMTCRFLTDDLNEEELNDTKAYRTLGLIREFLPLGYIAPEACSTDPTDHVMALNDLGFWTYELNEWDVAAAIHCGKGRNRSNHQRNFIDPIIVRYAKLKGLNARFVNEETVVLDWA